MLYNHRYFGSAFPFLGPPEVFPENSQKRNRLWCNSSQRSDWRNWYCRLKKSGSPVEVGSLSHCLQYRVFTSHVVQDFFKFPTSTVVAVQFSGTSYHVTPQETWKMVPPKNNWNRSAQTWKHEQSSVTSTPSNQCSPHVTGNLKDFRRG